MGCTCELFDDDFYCSAYDYVTRVGADADEEVTVDDVTVNDVTAGVTLEGASTVGDVTVNTAATVLAKIEAHKVNKTHKAYKMK